MGIFDDFKAKFKKDINSNENVISVTPSTVVGDNFDNIKRKASYNVIEWLEKRHGGLFKEIKTLCQEVVESENSLVDNSKIVKKANFKFSAKSPLNNKKERIIAVEYNCGDIDEYSIKEIETRSASVKEEKTRKIVAWDMEANEFEVYCDYNEEIENSLRKAGIIGNNDYNEELDTFVYEIFPYGKEKKKAKEIIAQFVNVNQDAQDVAAQTDFNIASTVLNTKLKINKTTDGDTWTVSVVGGGSNVIKQTLENKQFAYFNLKKALIDVGLVDASNVLDDNVTAYLTEQEVEMQQQQEQLQTVGTPQQQDNQGLQNFPGTATASKKKAFLPPKGLHVLSTRLHTVIDELGDQAFTFEEVLEKATEKYEIMFKEADIKTVKKAFNLLAKKGVISETENGLYKKASKKEASEEIVKENENPSETPKDNAIVDHTQEIPETPKDNAIIDEEQNPQETPETNDLIKENENPSETPKDNAIVDETQEPSEIPSEAGDVIKENVQESVTIRKSSIITEWNRGLIGEQEALKRLAELDDIKLPSDDPKAKKNDEKGVVSKQEVEVQDDVDNSEIIIEKENDMQKTPENNDLIKENESPKKTPNNTKNITDGDSGKLPKDTVEKKANKKRLAINTVGIPKHIVKLLEMRNEALYDNNDIMVKDHNKRILNYLTTEKQQGTMEEDKINEIEEGIRINTIL